MPRKPIWAVTTDFNNFSGFESFEISLDSAIPPPSLDLGESGQDRQVGGILGADFNK